MINEGYNDLILFLSDFIDKFGWIILTPLVILLVVTIGAMWMFYEKCQQNGIVCLIPFWNAIVFMRIVGRPEWHSFYLIWPPVLNAYLYFMFNDLIVIDALMLIISLFWVFFIGKVLLEVCNCFGKTKWSDYFLMLSFSGFYLLNLGLSHEARYLGSSRSVKETVVDAVEA